MRIPTGTIFRITEIVDDNDQIIETKLGQKAVEREQNLDIGLWRRGADKLDADLRKLSVAAALHLLVAEHGAEIAQAERHRPLAESVLNVGPRDPRRPLGPEGQRSALAVVKGVHLLADDIGVLTD